MDEIFFQNFFLLGMYCTNEHALYRKVEIFFQEFIRRTVRGIKQAKACLWGWGYIGGG